MATSALLEARGRVFEAWRALYSGWRVATVADGHVSAAGGEGARVRGVVSGWPTAGRAGGGE
eukprot:scaffold15105_cov106-Isochrysis_galbana.AAC.1